MDISLQKTVVFLFLILIGVLLKVKFQSKDEISGIKKIILNLALPATIFIALLGVKIELELLLLPLLALGLNLLLFFAMPLLLPILGIVKHTSESRTAKLLMPSLAPGLSCFPFVLEFLGKDYLAKAAMADLGNKIFVLIFLYLIAMNWHYNLQSKKSKAKFSKLKPMLKAMITEPVNMFILVALLLLGFGFTMDTLPFFLSETLKKLSLIMTPLVLLFIGLAVKIKRKQFFQIFSLLCLRASMVVLIVGLFVSIVGIQVTNEILLLLSFGLSACSFWPYAHIAAVDSIEDQVPEKQRTFHNNYAITILALSFPLSTILILGVLNSGSFLTAVPNIFMLAGLLFGTGILFPLVNTIQTKLSEQKIKTSVTENV